MPQTIVVLGAGFGGLMVIRELVYRLQGDEAEIVWVDQYPYHTLVTNLHELAAGTTDPSFLRVPLSETIARTKEWVRWQQGRIERIDVQAREVYLAEQATPLSYDYLVIGLGGKPATFGVSGVDSSGAAGHAFFIADIPGVVRLRNHVEDRFAGYRFDQRVGRITVVVCGAGFTGIEYLGELVDHVPTLCRRYQVSPAAVRLIVAEATDQALSGWETSLATYVVRRLQERGVIFHFTTSVERCTPKGVVLANGEEIVADTVVWTAGVEGNSLLAAAGLLTERGRVRVDEYLRPLGLNEGKVDAQEGQLKKDPLQAVAMSAIFAIGDSSLVANPAAGEAETTFYAPTAQLARKQGLHVGRNLHALLHNRPLLPFRYRHEGAIVSLGRRDAVGYVGPWQVRSGMAALCKRLALYRWLYLVGGLRTTWDYGLQCDIRGRGTL